MKNNKKEEKAASAPQKSPVALREEAVLKFWEENKIFEKSLEQRKDSPIYSFYDGPPFATGTPHYGHIVASTVKDVVPRYWTMRGYFVERKWGWDCHGLPIENIAEKELGITHKKEIIKMGVEKFNEFCRSKVLKYVEDWKVVIKRLGRWADMENSYKTMDMDFMESVWWVFKELWDKGFIYEGYRVIHICTRCETTLSQSEVSEGYKTVKDLSVIVKFPITDKKFLDKYCGGKPTSFLAWTTTPWSVPTTMALAIGADFDYVVFTVDGEQMICAKKRFEYITSKKPEAKFKIIAELKGKEIEHISFEHPFGKFYKNHEKVKNNPTAYKTHLTDYVSMEDGTGLVTINGAFGDIDMEAAKKIGLPVVVNVRMDGTFTEEMGEFAGMTVKPLENREATDVEIIKYLAHNNFLFFKEKYEHSYPHCWRCDTPLINYATSSWYVNVLKVKARALELAKEINWSPEHIKEGRFGNWLEGARDWSISRQRFWASVIPIWKCEKCDNMKVVGSVDELRLLSKEPITKIIFVRHGESEKNVSRIQSDLANKWPLTEKGEKSAKVIREIIDDQIDIIITSPILRAKETAQILNKKFKTKIIESDLIKEITYGEWNEKTVEESRVSDPALYEEYQEIKKDPGKRFVYKFGRIGESRQGVYERTVKFLNEVSQKYAGKTVLVVGHGITYATLTKYYNRLSIKEYFDRKFEDPDHNLVSIFYIGKEAMSFDLHKHVVDRIVFKCDKCNSEMHRVPDVLDTWFDSGSMPYAEKHYPFSDKEKFDKGFPADFIAEGADQTRCWFYYLHIIASAIKDKVAFKNVIVSGIVLAEDGKKMSKRLQNYPDPTLMFDKYGADALRLYLLSSPVMAADTLNFKESEVAELSRGMFRMLWNSYLFYQTYASKTKRGNSKAPSTLLRAGESQNLLDKWIVSELNILIKQVNESMENYELNRAAKAFPKFIDNFSNWYIRRSRDRFAKPENDPDRINVEETMRDVLVILAKLLAPFTPFVAEEIYKNLTGEESVHFADYPKVNGKLIDEELNEQMAQVRQIVTLGLAARAGAKIKVRQPIASLKIKNQKSKIKIDDELEDLIKDELNIKEIIFADDVKEENGWAIETDGKIIIALGTKITDELKEEGVVRDIARHIQTMRKDLSLTKEDLIEVYVEKSGSVAKILADAEWEKYIKEKTITKNIADFKAGEKYDMEKDLEVEGEKIKFAIKKIK